MRELRTSLTVVAVASAGIAGSLLVGRLTGMDGGDLAKLAVAMLPSVGGTVLAAAIARPLLAKAPIAWRMVSIATVAAAISLANLIVASRLMFLSGHAAKVLAILMAYSVAAGTGTALALAKSSRAGIERLMGAARRLGEGDLAARVGRLDAEPELRTLGVTMDAMAERISRSIEHDRAVEGMRRDLLNAVSHDLRTPLSRIKAVSEALEDGIIDDPEDLRRYVREMRISVDAMVKLVDDLFELVQAEPDQVTSEARVRFRSVLRAALDPCVSIAREKGLVVRTDIDGTGDALCSPRLERVLQNLLINAVRHTDDGEVLVQGRLEGADLVIEVKDTGEGISESHLPRVFEPFWRGDAARSSPGSGLGLTLARRLVEHLGGGIEVTSQVGEGSRFTVTIPAERPT